MRTHARYDAQRMAEQKPLVMSNGVIIKAENRQKMSPMASALSSAAAAAAAMSPAPYALGMEYNSKYNNLPNVKNENSMPIQYGVEPKYNLPNSIVKTENTLVTIQ